MPRRHKRPRNFEVEYKRSLYSHCPQCGKRLYSNKSDAENHAKTLVGNAEVYAMHGGWHVRDADKRAVYMKLRNNNTQRRREQRKRAKARKRGE